MGLISARQCLTQKTKGTNGDEPEPGDTDTEDQRTSELKSLTEIRAEERGAGGADARVGSPRRGELPDPARSRLVRKKMRSLEKILQGH